MADITAKAAVSVTNEIKARPALDALSADMSGSQFLDVMMARLTALGSDDQELKQIAKSIDDAGNSKDASVLRQLKGLREKAKANAAEEPQDVKLKIKEKIKARIHEIASRDDVPVKDDSSLKAMQKIADFLIKADSEGKLDLPPELLQKLNEFLAKGTDLKAYDIANFMRDFSDSFKSVLVNLNASTSADPLKWPQEIVDQLKELKIMGLAQAGEDVKLYDVVRVLKALVNAGEKAAIATLDEKIKNTLIPQDRADLLVNGANAKDHKQKVVDAVVADAAASAAIEAEANLSVLGKDASKQESMSPKAPFGQAALEPRADAKGQNTGNAQVVTPHVNAVLRAEILAAAPALADAKLAAGVSNITHASANALEGLTNNLSNTGARFTAALNATGQTLNNQPSEATQQILVQLGQRGGKTGSLSVQLTPAELGRVDIRMTTQRDGSVHMVIAADKPETLALLQKDASVLERAMQQAGINANAGNMSFNLREQRQSQHFEQGRKRFGRTELEETSVKEVALTVNAGVFTNDHVNYHA